MSTPAEILARYSIRTTEEFPNIGVYSLTASGTNTLIATLTGLTYFVKLKVNVLIVNNNTGTVTLNINSLGAKTIYKVIDNVKTVLTAKDLRKGEYAQLEYDGTDFVLLSNGYKEILKIVMPFIFDIGSQYTIPITIFVAPEDITIRKITMLKLGDFSGIDGSNTFQIGIIKTSTFDVIATKTFTTLPSDSEVIPLEPLNTKLIKGEEMWLSHTFSGTVNITSVNYQIEYV